MAAELRAVVEAERRRKSTFKCDILKDANDVGAAERELRHDCERFAGEIVDNVEQPVRSPVHGPRVHEVERPALVASRHRFKRLAPHVSDVSLAKARGVKRKSTIDASECALADHPAVSPHHDEQSSPTPAQAFPREGLKMLDQRRIVRTTGAILHRLLRDPDDAACDPLRGPAATIALTASSRPEGPCNFFPSRPDDVELKLLARDDSPHLRVLGLELPEPNKIARFKPGVLIAPSSDAIWVHPEMFRILSKKKTSEKPRRFFLRLMIAC